VSYELAIERAGAEVLLFKEFGSYQGDWLAKVVYEGKQMWIHGSYGSCSGCDAFQSEFDNCSHDCDGDGGDYYNPLYSNIFYKCNTCFEILERLIDFGKQYIYNNAHTQEELVAQFKAKDWGDYEEMCDFITKNAITEKVS
jgi:hypothetical protein